MAEYNIHDKIVIGMSAKLRDVVRLAHPTLPDHSYGSPRFIGR